mmetsp:Transcript_26890/g.40699  ORF Transcript_26890/g.40699 Transcript_26890/m.40699 type:complete len:368 (-) Transcript_26890:171-1274(-)|eukprot:CAMPEP_0178895026 /NCGR_PEP_ID=MMETSP0786-20121207/345_1 /TAXON_ID=186022 /ORGANISM="Thalassionema frauenfeldii, Strain CCMP 1798" /LENGTH=367 /DNA_ID=CAMNT_0020565185 /DNA_START=86 /DNA_END=1189 /DNA_ORIENTATION=+
MENYLGGSMMHRNLNEWEKYDWSIVQRLPHFSGSASVIGSFILIVTIICSRRRRSHPYHRLMLGMSFYDIFMSFFMAMAVWVHPENSCWDANDCQKVGTVASCTAYGFFYQLGAVTIPLYNVALATYIAFATKDHFTNNPSSHRRFDLVFHLVILVVGVTQAIIPLILEDYNPYDWLCMVVPWGQDENGNYLRGNLTTMIIYAYMNLIVVVVASCYVTAAMIYTFCTVVFKPDQQSRGTGIRVAIMGLLYTIPFYITWIIPSIFFYLFLNNWYTGSNPYDLTFFTRYFGLVYTAVFLPMQGFFNLFVYFVPLCLKVVGVDQTYNSVPRESSVYDSDGGADAPRESRVDDSAGADASTMHPTIYDQMC